MSTCTIDRIIEKVNKLPRLPDTALRLVNVINDPDSSMQTVVDTIRYDHTVTAEALRLCNSAYYGLARQVDSIDDYIPFIEPLVTNAGVRGDRLIYFRFAKHKQLISKDSGAQIYEFDPESGFEIFIDKIHEVIIDISQLNFKINVQLGRNII